MEYLGNRVAFGTKPMTQQVGSWVVMLPGLESPLTPLNKPVTDVLNFVLMPWDRVQIYIAPFCLMFSDWGPISTPISHTEWVDYVE